MEEGAQIGARPSRGTSHDPVRVPSPRPPPGGRGSPSGRARAAAILATLTLACGPSAPDDAGADDGGASDASIDAAGGDAATCLLVRPLESARVDVDGPCALELVAEEARVADLWVEGATIDGGAYLSPRVLTAGTHRFAIEGAGTLVVRVLGAPPGAIRIDRSLTWTSGALLDDPSTLGLARVLSAMSDEPAVRLDAWFTRFGTTAHSERLGPSRILEEVVAAQGADPRAWDLDLLPFTVTGVHHRIDLRDEQHCGEVRVSLASTHPLYSPFHLIFLFRRPAAPDDRRPDGTAHCAATALSLAALSALDDSAFLDAARALLDATLTRERFLLAETLEFIISPWEWRQWFPVDGALENRPLFQTVDTPRLNADGPDRDAFLAWVTTEADALAERRAMIPERFRAESARVNDGVPWIPLDLTGIDPSIATRHPTLRQSLELVGCPACHASDADFVQTRPDRSFSPFYEKELDARALDLRALAEGAASPPPHGPLQLDPVLPP